MVRSLVRWLFGLVGLVGVIGFVVVVGLVVFVGLIGLLAWNVGCLIGWLVAYLLAC